MGRWQEFKNIFTELRPFTDADFYVTLVLEALFIWLVVFPLFSWINE